MGVGNARPQDVAVDGPGNLCAASYTTSALTAGSHLITATYSGDSNFTAATSSAVSEIVDFTIAPPNGGTTSATASPGGQAVRTLAIDPPSGDTFAGPVTFTVTGLPTGATATFSPATIAAGATNVTLTITLPASAAVTPLGQPFGRGGLSVTLDLGVLPLAGLRRIRQRVSRLAWIVVLGVSGTALAVGIAGCGGSPGNGSQQQPQSYTLTVTAPSGSLSHQSTLTLTVVE